MKINSRDGQRHIASELAYRMGKHSLITPAKRMRKLQCQVLIRALLNGKHVKVEENGDLRVRL